MALITCHDASFAYEENIAVSNLNFSVESGDYLCIVGENGSGKSTLVKGLLGLKLPRQGAVRMDEGVLPGDVGYLPQQTVAQKDFPASAYEVVLSGRIAKRGLSPFYLRQDREAAVGNMKRINIWHLRDRCYRELSGGQQQRVLLARALCAASKALLLDEPASGLDPAATQEMYQIIDGINKKDGLTIIMVSHDVHNVLAYASHVLHLRQTQVFFGATPDYIKSEAGRAFISTNSIQKGGAHYN